MRHRRSRRWSLPAFVTVVLGCALVGTARAEGPKGAGEALSERYRALSGVPSASTHVVLGAHFGAGLRFNNPYRLSTQLGSTGESLSITAPYAMLTGGLTQGRPDGLQHGGALSVSFALSGVDQAVLTPAYLLLYRPGGRVLGYGRAGPAIVLSPDLNVGLEVAGGAAYFFTGALGLAVDVAGNLFYGAGTRDVKYAVYPVLSASLGLLVDLESLP
ncbi:hypothetical protein [Polyangium aurulentum]|uniref:hypothetical protein n=1 Tax=Polyangium aurulentum TaxID=2567896 RepID=UPI0010AEA47F|nr:hypothetical protein [Polyangium aurulentum]UQA56614.1 hypothetical protein E8A73_035695 [Polyangium aurulentum]